MTRKSNSMIARTPWGLVFLVVLFPAIMIPLGLVDAELTIWLHNLGFEEFGQIMKRSLFDGSGPGASDPAILFLLLNAGCYLYYAIHHGRPGTDRLRPAFGFIFFCSLFTGLGLVHSIKWVVGRARPNLVLEGDFPFSNWYEFGPQFVSDGIFYGSFPSGHTATVFLLITIAYLLAGDPFHSLKIRILGWLWGLGVLVLTLAMIVGRAITLDHWVTDSVGITLLSWIFIHLIYFYILKIPAQIRYLKTQGGYAPLPRYWEIRLLWHILLLTVGVMCLLIGSRAAIIQRTPWLVLLVIPGVLLVYRFTKTTLLEHRLSKEFFQPFADKQ